MAKCYCLVLLSGAIWLNSQSLMYDGDRQAPPVLLNLLLEGTDLDPGIWLMHHKSMLALPRRKASVSLNRRSFGSKFFFLGICRYVPDPTDLELPRTHL